MQADDALKRYLDSLLRELPESPAADAQPAPPSPTSPSAPAESERSPAPQPPPVEAPAPIETGASEKTAPVAAHFKALLFDVDGITLAVPLDRLSGVVPWNGELNSIPGTPPYVLGLLAHQDRNIRVVDAGHLLNPAAGDDGRPARSGGYVVLLGDGGYGLACDRIREMVEVDPAEVRWRRGGSRRAWFAGIMTGRMCALLEVDELNRHLAAVP